MTSLRQPQPESPDGVFWRVFDHLAEAELSDPAAPSDMTPEQRDMFAIGTLRSEVNSGGFDSYFRYHGDTAMIAREAAGTISRSWQLLVEDACRCFGDTYPTDQATRENALDALDERDPQTLDRLDGAFYALEADDPADERLDAFIWSHRDAFFS